MKIVTRFTEFVGDFTILVGAFEVTIIAGTCITLVMVHITIGYHSNMMKRKGKDYPINY